VNRSLEVSISKVKEPDKDSPTGQWVVLAKIPETGPMQAGFVGHQAEHFAKQYAMWLGNRRTFLPDPPKPETEEEESELDSMSMQLPAGTRAESVSLRSDGRTIDVALVLDRE
jgi:hypothetical protein